MTARTLRTGRAALHRPAFTLIELLVSLAVLTIAMVAVASVFALTTRTASHAAAYSEVQNWARQFTRQIEEDLRHVDPASGPLIIVGRTQAAGLTADDMASGKFYRVLVGEKSAADGYDPDYATGTPNSEYSNPRIDQLAFVTHRPLASQAPALRAPPDDPFLNGVRFAPSLVMYGHAASARAVWNGTNYEWPTAADLVHVAENDADVMSPLPANRWHLSRRLLLLIDPTGSAGTDFDLDAPARLRVSMGQPTRKTSPLDGSEGDVARYDLRALNYRLSPFSPDAPNPPLRSPYIAGDWNSIMNRLERLLYTDVNGAAGPIKHFATVLEEVPVELQTNLAVHMLPGCAWFHVEFLMPEDPRNSVTYSAPTPGLTNTSYSYRSDMPRWMSVQPGRTYIFVPDTEENRHRIALELQESPSVNSTRRLHSFGRRDHQAEAGHSSSVGALEQRIIRTWPYAIRITVRVFDPRGRLGPEEAVVRTVVHRFE